MPKVPSMSEQLDIIHRANTLLDTMNVRQMMLFRQNTEHVNVVGPLKGAVSMYDVHVLERAFPRDRFLRLSGGFLHYAFGNLASAQPSQMKRETLLFDHQLYREGDMSERVDALANEGMGNIFDKKMLLFPVFGKDHTDHSYLAVFLNPRGLLSGEPGTCEQFLFGTGEMEKFETENQPQIMQFMRSAASFFEHGKRFQPTGSASLKLESVEMKNIEGVDKVMAILNVLEKTFAFEEEPDMEALLENEKDKIINWRVQMDEIEKMRKKFEKKTKRRFRTSRNKNEVYVYLMERRDGMIRTVAAKRESEKTVDPNTIQLD